MLLEPLSECYIPCSENVPKSTHLVLFKFVMKHPENLVPGGNPVASASTDWLFSVILVYFPSTSLAKCNISSQLVWTLILVAIKESRRGAECIVEGVLLWRASVPSCNSDTSSSLRKLL